MSSIKEPVLVIGIDLGTTFSGVAHAVVRKGSDPDNYLDISTVRGWPTTPTMQAYNSDRQKVPSQIHYGNDGIKGWGYAIPNGDIPCQWFKLLLTKTANLPVKIRYDGHVIEALERMNGLNKKPVIVTADYLKKLFDHALEIIKRYWTEPMINSLSIHVVVTVPAIWKEAERELTLNSVKLAGILDRKQPGVGPTTLSLVSEPEAAALIVFKDIKRRLNITPGDVFITLDAGGGTVDIISYVAEQLEPKMTIRECVPGSGDVAGATLVDEAFTRYLKEDVVGLEDWLKLSANCIKEFLNTQWENGIKANFDGQEQYWSMSIAGRDYPIDPAEIRRCFRTATSKINDLVKEQIGEIQEKTGKEPKLIILVGGFGRSPFVYNELKKKFGKKGIEIVQDQGDRPWTAICRGAVLHGAMELGHVGEEVVHVTYRKARASYGWTYSEQYDDNKHDVRERQWDQDRQKWMVFDLVKWIIHRGDDMDTNADELQFSYSKVYTPDVRGVQTVKDVLVKSLSEIPPGYLDYRMMEKVGNLYLDTPVPVEQLPTNRNGCHVFDWDLHVSINGDALVINSFDADGNKLREMKLSIDNEVQRPQHW